jgi:ribosomal protein L3
MMRGLIGKKIGMSQVFNDGGQAIPVTVVEVARVWSPK